MSHFNHSALILLSFGMACVVAGLFLRQHRYGYIALVVAVAIFCGLRAWLW